MWYHGPSALGHPGRSLQNRIISFFEKTILLRALRFEKSINIFISLEYEARFTGITRIGSE